MKNILFAVICSLLSLYNLSAQSNIIGNIQTVGGTPAAFTTVLLRSAQDSSMQKGAVTAENGSFSFDNVPNGKYFMEASLLGAGRCNSEMVECNGDTYTLPTLILVENATELGQVTIVAKKPIIEVKADRTILNVEGSVSSSGLNGLEVLRKAPGVMLDNNDNISLKGKNGVKIMVDGREVPMDNKDIAALLKGMRSEEIVAIEVITNPSARYDAAGNAGIINIKTKKGLALGTNGTIGGELTYGKSLKSGMNLRVNHRTQKMNIYTSYNNHFGDWENEMNFHREQSGQLFKSTGYAKDNNNNHHYKVGADYFINSKHTVGVLYSGRNIRGPWSNNARTYISSLTDIRNIDSVLVADSYQPQYRQNNSINLNYRFADTLGHELTIDLDRGRYSSQMVQYVPNYYKNLAENVIFSQRIYAMDTPTDVDISTVKVDYAQKLGKGQIGIGGKIAKVKTDNTFDFYDIDGENRTLNINRSNRFIYDEMITAGYLNYNVPLNKKWSLQTGLRAENTSYMGDLISQNQQTDNTVERTYLAWFPSAALSYNLSEKHQFALNYSRRIDRPSYQDLNPFESQLDELTFRKGNPFLLPQFTNKIELNHTFMGFLTTSLGYSRTTDMYTDVIDTSGRNATFIINKNVALQDNYSLNIGAPMPIAKWWEGYLNFSLYHNYFEANFREGYSYNVSVTAYNLYSEQNFTLPGDWKLQLSGWYNSPSVWGANFRSKAQGAMDFGVQKKVFNGNGTMRLRFGDILRTAGWASVNDFTPGLYMLASGRWESQTVTFGMDYNFGNQNVKSARNRKTGLEDESNRIKK